MSLLQRLRTPFSEVTDDDPVQPHARVHSVGAILRDRREELDLDLDSVGEMLCIKPIFLAALEQGRPQDLPGPAYASGFVRAYAHYLGLDGDRVLDSYKAESADAHAKPDLALPVPLGARSLPGGAILLVGLILALCGYGTWYYLATGDRSRPERVAAVPAELQRAMQEAGTPLVSGTTSGLPAVRSSSGLVSAQDAPPIPRISAVVATPTIGAPAPGIVASPAAAALPLPPSGAGAPSAPAIPPTAGKATSNPSSTPATASSTSPKPVAAGAPPIPPPPIPATATSAPAKPGGANFAAVTAPPAAVPPATAQSATATPVTATTGDAAARAGGRVEIRALADCWIQIRSADDQAIVFSRVLKAGETYHVPRGGLFLRTGNAGALAIAVDGKAAPAIGGVGTLRRNVTLEPDPLLAGTAVHG